MFIAINIMKAITSLAVGAVLLLAGSASAATISDPLFSNGDTTIDALGNSSVNGTFTLQVGANEVCEVLRTQAAPQAFVDTQVGGSLGYQQGTYTNVPFSVKVSPNTGTYYPTVQCAGIWGGNHSVDGADNVVVSSNLGTIRVTAQGSGSVGSGGSSLDQLLAQIAALTAQVGCWSSGGTWANNQCTPKPAVNPVCTSLAAFASFSFGMTGPNVVAAQNYIMAHGGFIPAIASGAASPGYWGNQSAMALVQAKNANQCI